MLNPYVDIALMELHSARGPPQSDLWERRRPTEPTKQFDCLEFCSRVDIDPLNSVVAYFGSRQSGK
jgi:hypothetical protein